MFSPKQFYMEMAIAEAKAARQLGDYAIGAVVVKGDKIIAKSGNRVKLDNDPTHHAELLAISDASRALGYRHLDGCILYTTHEPCPMCAGAAVFAKMYGVVCGTRIDDMTQYRMMYGNNGLGGQ